jgi:hypothetical protein
MYTLLGAEVSLYTGKVRAYLRYKRIPFTEVVASAEVRTFLFIYIYIYLSYLFIYCRL